MHFSFSSLLLAEYKSSLSLTTAKSRLRRVGVLSSLSFVLCKVLHANGAVTPSFHCLAPFKVTSALSDQGPEYSKVIQSPLVRPVL